eukprot:TRINITY_DN7734_c0_g1_i1.p1 TRINITY_DN7734_c0_g1~~TRINITY_DN7734_c0_g1_i1.p1  ORF type:complete len:277 (+),score=45.59 TRINITY_DN7734_c0_g1_i1:125-955(+)
MPRQSEYRCSEWKEYARDHFLFLLFGSLTFVCSLLLLSGCSVYVDMEAAVLASPSPDTDYRTPVLPTPPSLAPHSKKRQTSPSPQPQTSRSNTTILIHYFGPFITILLCVLGVVIRVKTLKYSWILVFVLCLMHVGAFSLCVISTWAPILALPAVTESMEQCQDWSSPQLPPAEKKTFCSQMNVAFILWVVGGVGAAIGNVLIVFVTSAHAVYLFRNRRFRRLDLVDFDLEEAYAEADAQSHIPLDYSDDDSSSVGGGTMPAEEYRYGLPSSHSYP